jgi:hypothetical protein
MYHEGKRIISHHKSHVIMVWIVIVLVALTVGGIISAKHLLKSDTNLGKTPKPVVNTVVAASSPTKQFTEGIFTISLPKDWVYVGRAQDIYRAYIFENTATDKGVRQLDIYVDNIPTGLGVNQVLPVTTAVTKIYVTSVSGNCAQFTGDKVPGNPATPAKWQGVNFLCDLGNYTRNVVGTSTDTSVNSLTLTGPTAGTHKLFFTYTDNSAEPDYQILYDSLQSFRLD